MKTINELTKRTKTRYLKTTNTLKSSNFSMNLDTLDAYSYGWWKFVTKFKGKIVINKARYSSSTHKHQSKVLYILGYNYDLKLRFTKKSLSNIESALENEIELTNLVIKNIEAAIKKPRTQAKKNKERQAEIESLLVHINDVTKLIKEAV